MEERTHDTTDSAKKLHIILCTHQLTGTSQYLVCVTHKVEEYNVQNLNVINQCSRYPNTINTTQHPVRVMLPPITANEIYYR
jgi:hypothetical protein